jgi:hypothetical protein
MKHRNGERVERRRASAELNLLEGGGKVRGVRGRSARGCASMLGQVLVGASLLLIILLGLR